ncbi:hypothetical protein ECE50_005685 [Chitinophaga sp. Mgbs1]|uniref:Uncharacterized protein n=1 Tax=Chitinophaga solisilvae TaxID=1233460 RepID=A0A433WH33_9BACT|nr:hypothetical protein [Chitinophaga solisilvae]
MKNFMRLMAFVLLIGGTVFATRKAGLIKPVAETAVAAGIPQASPYHLTYNDEVTVKYIYGATVQPTCEGPDKKIINGVCTIGWRVNDQSYRSGSGTYYVCVYHYEFRDGTSSGSYVETNYAPCPLS